MNNSLKKTTTSVSSPLHNQRPSHIDKILYPLTWMIVIFAFMAGAFLLISDLFTIHLSHMPLSAAPLLLIGAAYLAFQLLIRAQHLDLFKALIVSSAFILWGIDQLLPTGWFATTLGDIVIILYVIDLGWMMVDRLKQQWHIRYAQSEEPACSEDQQYISQTFVELSKRNAPLLKRNRLAPLPCTCASPLAPLHSSTCCCAMKEASRH